MKKRRLESPQRRTKLPHRETSTSFSCQVFQREKTASTTYFWPFPHIILLGLISVKKMSIFYLSLNRQKCAVHFLHRPYRIMQHGVQQEGTSYQLAEQIKTEFSSRHRPVKTNTNQTETDMLSALYNKLTPVNENKLKSNRNRQTPWVSVVPKCWDLWFRILRASSPLNEGERLHGAHHS